MEIINCTPHPIRVVLADHEVVFEPSGTVPRIAAGIEDAGDINGIPLVRETAGPIENLPDPQEGMVLIVSALVRKDPRLVHRTDLVSPDTFKGAIRDDSGNITGTTRFIR